MSHKLPVSKAGSWFKKAVGGPSSHHGSAQPLSRHALMDSVALSQSVSDGHRGIQRAARLLLALGPDQAAPILRELGDREIELISNEMVRIDRISAEERKEILTHFESTVKEFEAPVRGGMDVARDILERGLGAEAASSILGRLSQRDLYRDFEFLERIDPPMLASALAQEHAQIAAVALSYLKPNVAAAVIRHLPPDFRSDTALRIARSTRIQPDAVQRVARVLREKFEKRASEVFSEVGGADTLANILNHLGRGEEDEILSVLGSTEPDIMEDVRDRLYTFEELIDLEHREMRILIARVDDDTLLATALRGAQEELRRHFFSSMSQNRAADILEEMDHRGPISIKEITDARTYVLQVARKLDDDGAIVIKKDKEEYI